MSVEISSEQLIKVMQMTDLEISVAHRAAELIRRYRLKGRGVWSGPTADEFVRGEVLDPRRQIPVLRLACEVEKEERLRSAAFPQTP